LPPLVATRVFVAPLAIKEALLFHHLSPLICDLTIGIISAVPSVFKLQTLNKFDSPLNLMTLPSFNTFQSNLYVTSIIESNLDL
jgi:hypothetical protein